MYDLDMDRDAPDDYVLVPVPRDRVLDVMAFLTAQRSPTPAASAATSAPLPEDGLPWDHESLRWLMVDPNTPEKQIVVLECLARKTGDWVTAAELRRELRSAFPDELRGKKDGRALGAILRALGLRAAYYDGRDRPFESEWDPVAGHNHYRMPAGYAQTVLDGAAARRRGERE
jgi:hypothetical protein